MSYQITEKDGFFVIENKNGETLSMAAPKLLEQDGFAFKDLAGTGELVPYEDWRLDPLTRAEDLAKRLSIEEIAGLMLYSSHQSLPAVTEGPFKSHYSGKSREEAGALKWDLTDEQKKFLSDDHIRHILLSLVSDPMTAARWSNELNKKCEELPFGIPVNIATDPRHGAPSIADAEFKSSESGVSIWPEGIGLTAAGDLGMVREFAKTAAKEYRAMGITTELGPQIDLANPLVPSEFEPYCDAIIAEFGVEIRVLVETLFGDRVPDGTLPYNLPADMETVEAHCEDLPDDYEAYTDSVGNTYVRGYALGKK